MKRLGMEAVSLECPHCGTANTIAANHVKAETRIACSRCRSDLGPWSDLQGREIPKRDTDRPAPEEGTAPAPGR